MKSYRFAPIQGRGRTVALWLIISMISDLVTIALSAFDLHMLSRLYTLTQAEIDQWQMLGLTAFISVPIYLVNIVLICMWTYRASANAHSLRKGLETSPPWAVGWYFIPFANLWKPFAAMKDIWKASFSREAGQPTPSDGVLGGWWAFWIISGIAGNISFRLGLSASEPPAFVASAWIGIISAITGIMAAWMLRRVVLQVSAAQTASHAHKRAAGDETLADAPTELAPQ